MLERQRQRLIDDILNYGDENAPDGRAFLNTLTLEELQDLSVESNIEDQNL